MSTGGPPAVDVDVVVAGAGGAGLAAALRAAQGGCSVLVAETSRTFRTASNTAMSTSMIPAGGSRWQGAAGIEDSPERFLADVMAKSGGTADRTVASALTAVAPDLVAWLADSCGVPLELATDFSYPGHSALRCHTVPDRAGATLHRHLLAAVGAQAQVTLVVPRRLVGVHLAPDATVVAAELALPDDTREVVTTGAVVLATCGFGADRALVDAHIPEIAGALYFGSDAARGDALTIGATLGADTGCLDAYQGHGSVATPHGILVTWASVMLGGIVVNRTGARFGDETCGYSEYARLVVAQPHGDAWVVLDGPIDASCRSFADYQRLLEAGALRDAPDAVALAAVTGADPDTLAETLGTARRAATRTAPDPFGRTKWDHPLEPPYRAVRVTGALFHTQGGLLVDPRAGVLRQGERVPGLYAAGGAAVGISGHGAGGYLAGNGLLGALGLGYLAGLDIVGTRIALPERRAP